MDFYRIDETYYQLLAKQDKKLEYLKKSGYIRPFIGKVVKENSISYYAPLSSPKKKHRYLKENVDLLKIQRGKLGVINLNNMIPVPEGYQERLILSSIKDEKYRRLLYFQKEWIKENSFMIQKKANCLYELAKQNKLDKSLKKRCCEFQALEEVAKWQTNMLYFQEEKEIYQCA